MSVYKPTYRDKKTGESKEAAQWWYEFTFAGKRYREPAKTTRKTIAVEAEKQRRLQLERALAGMPSEANTQRIASVKERVAEYLDHYGNNHRAASLRFTKQRLAHVGRLLSNCLACDLNESKIQWYIKTRLAEGVGGRTINMEIGELSRAMKVKWSVAWPNVRKLEEPKDVGRALALEEEGKLIEAAQRSQSVFILSFIRIALLTGMRSGEITGLTWGQVNLADRVLKVGKAKTSSGTGRMIPINQELFDVLKAHAEWYGKTFEGAMKPGQYLFPWGSPIPTDTTRPTSTMKTAWGNVRKAASVDCRFHDLRHTVATKMAEAGVSESTMLALMGHVSRAMLERYSHIRMAAKRSAVDVLITPPPKRRRIQAGYPKNPPRSLLLA